MKIWVNMPGFVLLFLAMLFFSGVRSYAAFPINTPNFVSVAEGQQLNTQQNSQTLLIDEEENKKPSATTGIFGLSSFVAAIAALLFLFIPFASILSSTLAVGAIVLGAIGLNKPNKGLAIAGMSLGIIEIVAMFVALVIVLAAL